MRSRLFIVIVILLIIIPLLVSMVILALDKKNSPVEDAKDNQTISRQTTANILKKLISGPAGNQNLRINEAHELLKQGDYRVVEVVVSQNGIKSTELHLFTVLKREDVLIKPTDEWDPILEDKSLPDRVREELKNHLIQGNAGIEGL